MQLETEQDRARYIQKLCNTGMNIMADKKDGSGTCYYLPKDKAQYERVYLHSGLVNDPVLPIAGLSDREVATLILNEPKRFIDDVGAYNMHPLLERKLKDKLPIYDFTKTERLVEAVLDSGYYPSLPVLRNTIQTVGKIGAIQRDNAELFGDKYHTAGPQKAIDVLHQFELAGDYEKIYQIAAHMKNNRGDQTPISTEDLLKTIDAVNQATERQNMGQTYTEAEFQHQEKKAANRARFGKNLRNVAVGALFGILALGAGKKIYQDVQGTKAHHQTNGKESVQMMQDWVNQPITIDDNHTTIDDVAYDYVDEFDNEIVPDNEMRAPVHHDKDDFEPTVDTMMPEQVADTIERPMVDDIMNNESYTRRCMFPNQPLTSAESNLQNALYDAAYYADYAVDNDSVTGDWVIEAKQTLENLEQKYYQMLEKDTVKSNVYHTIYQDVKAAISHNIDLATSLISGPAPQQILPDLGPEMER